MKRKKQNPYLRLGIKAIVIFLLLVLLSGYVRHTHENSLDRRFFDGISFALSVREATGREGAPTPTPKQKTEREEIEEFGQELFGEDWELFKRIIACESSWDVKAFNGADTGLAQINRVHGIAPKWLKNWKINLLVAKQLFDEQGTKPWNASRNCWEKEER